MLHSAYFIESLNNVKWAYYELLLVSSYDTADMGRPIVSNKEESQEVKA